MNPHERRVQDLLLSCMPANPLAGPTVERASWSRAAPRDRLLSAAEQDAARMTALRSTFTQYNPHVRANVILLDIDINKAGRPAPDWQTSIADAALFQGVQLPVPNVATTRRASGNQQLVFILGTENGVGLQAHQSRAAKDFLSSVKDRLQHWYSADRACVARLMRGMKHSGQDTRWIHAEEFSLRDLSSALPAVPVEAQGPNLSFSDDSRNWAIFRRLDHWAAKNADLQRSAPTEFARQLDALAVQLHQEHGTHVAGRAPYCQAELRATVRSVTRRTDSGKNSRAAEQNAEVTRSAARYAPKIEGAALRKFQRSHRRAAPLSDEQRRENIQAAQAAGAAERADLTRATLCAAAVRLAERGEAVTAAKVAAETQLMHAASCGLPDGRPAKAVSLRSAKTSAHSAAWRAAAQGVTPQTPDFPPLAAPPQPPAAPPDPKSSFATAQKQQPARMDSG